MLLSLLCLSTLVLGLALSLAGSTREEREQAALLPFADDPEAARRVARDTGKICRQVVRPSRNPARPPARRSSPEPTPSSRDGCLQHESALRGRQRPLSFASKSSMNDSPSTAVRTWLKGFRP